VLKTKWLHWINQSHEEAQRLLAVGFSSMGVDPLALRSVFFFIVDLVLVVPVGLIPVGLVAGNRVRVTAREEVFDKRSKTVVFFDCFLVVVFVFVDFLLCGFPVPLTWSLFLVVLLLMLR